MYRYKHSLSFFVANVLHGSSYLLAHIQYTAAFIFQIINIAIACTLHARLLLFRGSTASRFSGFPASPAAATHYLPPALIGLYAISYQIIASF
jgi:hypothetical protein